MMKPKQPIGSDLPGALAALTRHRTRPVSEVALRSQLTIESDGRAALSSMVAAQRESRPSRRDWQGRGATTRV